MIKSNLKKITLFFLLWCIGNFFIYQNSEREIKANIVKTSEERVKILRLRLKAALSMVYSMQTQMHANIELAELGMLQHPNYSDIKDYPEHNRFAADGFETNTEYTQGSLSGAGRLNELNKKVKQEIKAALALKLNIGRKYDRNHIFGWVYYISKNNFIIVEPKTKFEELNFTDALYKGVYWLPALPENNPHRDIIITDVYEDEFEEQGFMVTILAPVYIDDEFRGVIGLDMGVAELREALSTGNVIGSSSLCDEKGTLIASVTDFKVGDKLDICQDGSSKIHDSHINTSKKIYSSEVIENQIYLVHETKKLDIVRTVFKKILFQILILTFVICIFYLLNALSSALEKQKILVGQDDLSKLLNRRAIEAIFEKLMVTTRRKKESLYLLMLDIDYFKNVNDTYGHGAGDEVICAIADILKVHSRDSDFVSRIGGEEYLIVSINDSKESVIQFAERLRREIKKAMISEFKIKVTASFGCVQCQTNEGFSEALKRADIGLYKAKDKGRNLVVFVD